MPAGGVPDPTSGPVVPGFATGNAIAWGILFLVFVVMTDIPPVAPIGAGLAWLLFVSVLLKYGPEAFGTIKTVNIGAKV